MYLRQTQLFWGVSPEFLKKMMSMATPVSFQATEVVFRKNDPAEWFYILIKGRIKLCPDKIETNACCAECTGEAFGWDSLIDQKYYRTSAVCVTPASVLKLARHHMNLRLDEDPYSAAIFFRHLAGALGNCLMERWTDKAAKKASAPKSMAREFV